MSEINILMSVNKKFLELSEEMIFSLLHYSSRPIVIYLMYVENELTTDDLKRIEEFVSKTGKGKLIPLLFDAKHIEGAPTDDGDGNYFGLEAYSRLFCSFYLPEQVEKILYLDVDMICTGDIAELYDQDFENKSWMAVRDEGVKEDDLSRLSLPVDCEYINSGMLLINVKKIREFYTVEQIIKGIMDNRKILIYPDQDFINKFFYGDIKVTNPKFNLIAKDYDYNNLSEKPLIIHYAGSFKPWGDNVSRFNYEYIEPYYEILRIQGKEEKLQKLLDEHKQYGYRK